MRVDLGLKGAELRLPPQFDLTVQVVELQRRGQEAGQVFSKMDVGAGKQQAALVQTQSHGADDLLSAADGDSYKPLLAQTEPAPLGRTGGTDLGAAAVHAPGHVIRQGIPAGGDAAGRQQAAAVGQQHLVAHSMGADRVGYLLQMRPGAEALPQVGQALVGNVHTVGLALDHFISAALTEAGKDGEQQYHPRRVDHKLGQQNMELQFHHGGYRPGQEEQPHGLAQFPDHGDPHQEQAGRLAAEKAAAQGADDAECHRPHTAGQSGKAARRIKIAVDTADEPGADAGHRPAQQPGSRDADDTGVDIGAVSVKAAIGGQRGQQAKQGRQHQLQPPVVRSPVQERAQGLEFHHQSRGKRQETDI